MDLHVSEPLCSAQCARTARRLRRARKCDYDGSVAQARRGMASLELGEPSGGGTSMVTGAWPAM